MLKSLKFGIIEARLNMKSERNILENILIHSFIIVLHIKKQCLLVVDVEVVFDLVIEFRLGELRQVLVVRACACAVRSLRLLCSTLVEPVIDILRIS